MPVAVLGAIIKRRKNAALKSSIKTNKSSKVYAHSIEETFTLLVSKFGGILPILTIRRERKKEN